MGRRRVLLVGWFRSIVPEGADGPFGGQGGFADTLAPAPYSLANGCLKAFADADPELARRYDIELIDLAEPLELEDEREEVRAREADVERILARDPEIVGFSAYCWNADAVHETAARLKRRRPDLVVVVGGRATEGDAFELARGMPFADVVICGEGEIPFAELLRRGFADLDGVPGIVFRTPDGVKRGGAPAAVRCLDEIPSPYLAGTLFPAQNGVMLELSRGCLHACSYCTWNASKRLRHLGPSRIEAEIRWALAAGHRHITLIDSALNYDTEWLAQAVAAIRRADPDGAIHFTYNVRHDCISEEQIALLGQLPTHALLLGIETLSAAPMAAVARAAVDVAELRTRLEAISRGVKPPVASIVLGLPGDTEEGFNTTLGTLLDWTRPLPDGPPIIGTVLVSLLQVYRGSSLWRRREELGLRFAERGIPYLLSSPGFPPDALARCKADLVRRMRHQRQNLKAAEAIVLMEAEGGIDPWLRRRRVEALLAPWRLGGTLEGWTLERIGVIRDTGEGVLLRFRWKDGDTARIRVVRRNGVACQGTRHYAVELRPPGADALARERERLERMVILALDRGERRLEQRLAERRRVRE
jgi:radical SAM superfamily enzyme YgiQ (UPF0313 family)